MKRTSEALVLSLPKVQTEAVQSRRVLIVDDEKEILQAYKDILNPKTNVVSLKSSRSKVAASGAPADSMDGLKSLPFQPAKRH